MSLPIVPKKSLGQNFLNSPRVISKIIDAAEPTKGDIILEIGPGLGAITQQLVHCAGKVIAVEKDYALFETLSETFSREITAGTLDLISGDILDFDPEYFHNKKTDRYKIAANIPYNITGLIIRKFLSTTHQPERMVLLIQKEVAARILARDKKHSLLSLSVHVYGTPQLITNVARGNFNPPPRVDSAVIKISGISRKNFPNRDFEELFFTIIHAGFAHKRKMLVKNLVDAKISSRTNLESLLMERKLPVTVRSEDVSLDDWLFITNMLYNNH
jgi:16S rRNA (adenine1518-N6/adenine1519-N6)-dimethyltransferase